MNRLVFYFLLTHILFACGSAVDEKNEPEEKIVAIQDSICIPAYKKSICIIDTFKRVAAPAGGNEIEAFGVKISKADYDDLQSKIRNLGNQALSNLRGDQLDFVANIFRNTPGVMDEIYDEYMTALIPGLAQRMGKKNLTEYQALIIIESLIYQEGSLAEVLKKFAVNGQWDSLYHPLIQERIIYRLSQKSSPDFVDRFPIKK